MQKNKRMDYLRFKYLIALILLISYTEKLCAQKCPQAYDYGTLINTNLPEEAWLNICFRKEALPITIPDLYSTKYTVLGSGGKELYNISFYFFKAHDSILVNYVNVISGKMVVKSLTYLENSAIRIFKNYKPNDDGIKEGMQYITLFTVPDLERPYIVLNEFQLLDDSDSYLSLSPINPEKLQQHHSEVAIYNSWKDSMNIEKEKEKEKIVQRKIVVADLFTQMKKYKEQVINKIVEGESNLIFQETIEGASIEAQMEFKERFDPVFSKLYKSIFPFEHYENELTFTFICNADGKVEDSRTKILSKNPIGMDRFVDSFNIHISPLINSNIFKTISVQKNNPKLIDDFNNRFQQTIEELKLSNPEFFELKKLRSEIYEELDRYAVRVFKLPAMYIYFIKYRSDVVFEEWIYKINRKGVEKIGPKGSVIPIPEKLIQTFTSYIVQPKIGKYKVKICSVFINDKLLNQDIQSY